MKTKQQGAPVFSPVKWQQEQKLLKSMRIINDRNALKTLNREEIIAYRLPFHEAILRKLNNNGFFSSAEYLKQLIEFQDAYRNAAGEESIIWQRPRLIYQKNLLEQLAESLQQAEKAHTQNHTDVEIDILLKMATELCFGSEHWWWLGHQILFIILKTSEDYDEDRGKRRALLRYVFGRFLFQNARELRMALEHLEISRQISAEMSWNINILFEENGTIFSQACILIHKIRIIQARSILLRDPKNTLKLFHEIKKRALEGCYYEGVVESYLLKGNCEMQLYDTDNAIASFNKGLDVLEKHDDIDLKCEILKSLGIAYLRHGSLPSALKTLHKLNDFAHQNKRADYVAQAHKYLGEFYLKEGTARNATPLLMAAVKIFGQAGDSGETAKTTNLAAISVGIELMPMFSEIIKNSDPKFSSDHNISLSKLICWKDSREIFWKNADVSRFSIVSTQTMENFSNSSKTDMNLNAPETEDFEELLGMTGLDAGCGTHGSISNLTDFLSNNEVEKSGNTIFPPNTTEEASNFMSATEKETTSFNVYISVAKEKEQH